MLIVQTVGRCHVPLLKMIKSSLFGGYDKRYYGNNESKRII